MTKYVKVNMKKIFRILRNIFAIIGVLFVGFWAFLELSPAVYYHFDIEPSTTGLCKKNIGKLRHAGSFQADTLSFSLRIVQDSARAEEIRNYFQLDTLYAADAPTWDKALAIGKFVATHIPHDNQRIWPDSVDAIGLWEYTQNVAPAFNCRLHSVMAFELFLATGIIARFVTCLPEDEHDNDCHVVNEVWLPEQSKWAMIDTDMGGHYVTSMEGTPLSLKEMRDNYIAGTDMMLYPGFKNGHSKHDYYYAYMAKNTYWFACWGELSYYQENYKHEEVVRDHYIELVPSGFTPFGSVSGQTVTSDADWFWAAP